MSSDIKSLIANCQIYLTILNMIVFRKEKKIDIYTEQVLLKQVNYSKNWSRPSSPVKESEYKILEKKTGLPKRKNKLP